MYWTSFKKILDTPRFDIPLHSHNVWPRLMERVPNIAHAVSEMFDKKKWNPIFHFLLPKCLKNDSFEIMIVTKWFHVCHDILYKIIGNLFEIYFLRSDPWAWLEMCVTDNF